MLAESQTENNISPLLYYFILQVKFQALQQTEVPGEIFKVDGSCLLPGVSL